jgi:hypothetical protein
VDLDDAYYDLLGTLVAADEAAGRAQTFVITWSGPNDPAFVGVSGVADDAPVPTDVQVDNMAEFGWVRVTHADGKVRHFALRAEGQRAWRRRVAEISRVPVPVNLDWTVARPLLKQIFEAYSGAGAPDMGVDMLPQLEDPDHGRATRALLFELARAGYLDVTWESADGPRMVRPGIPALRMFAGWPISAAQDVLDELTAALDTEIERTSDSDKRSKLIAVRDGLLGAARDIAIAWAERKIGAA